MLMLSRFVRALPCLLLASSFAAEKTLPPPGIAVSASDRAELEAGLLRLGNSMAKLQTNPLYPDVAVYHKAVRFALEGNEFYKPEEIQAAKKLLAEGEARAAALANGSSPWATATGLVVRGYVSKIDRSIQPYGLVIPPSYAPDRPHRWRLDAWFHGRGDTLTEVSFITGRESSPGEFTPRDTIVLHLYGRYCNASKFAGETDFFEALEAVKKQYPIDEHRILVRGFSMGGATTWHIAAHHAGEWAAAAPGAGFAETAEYSPLYRTGQVKPEWWEQKLWHLTNATDYALNFAQLPVVAYNGEIDPQKQAADIMARYMAEEGMHLSRVVGPGTAHKYHPDSKVEISRILDGIAEKGNDFYPRTLHFTTWTLAYNQMKWITLDGLEQHWERARIDAEIQDSHTITARTRNISALTLHFGPGGVPLDTAIRTIVVLDGQQVAPEGPASDRSWTAHFRKVNGKWQSGEETGLHKKHNLQGPIDDAFLDSFIMVTPTGKPLAPPVSSWVTSEESRALREWRRQFRGEAQERKDSEITDAEIAGSNLILWGDPGSNKILSRIQSQLPIQWTADSITVGNTHFPAASHALVMIYPNPLNPRKYVVLNSGFTFREAAYASNSLQNAALPDYAVVDTRVPPDSRWPGKIADANFFSEQWSLLPSVPHQK